MTFTRLAAVIGHPARHSRSPAIHNAAFTEIGLDWVFTSFEVPAGAGERFLEAMRVLRLGGLSVTMPLKAEIAAAADTATAEVQTLGAANCVVPMADGRLRAVNTDVVGFPQALRADADLSPEGLRVALIGAGGAARAVAWGLATAGVADLAIVNRTPERAAAAAAAANTAANPKGSSRRVGRVASPGDISDADLVINATSVGMGADTSMPCDPCLLGTGQVAVDLIYEPTQTPWLRALAQRGVRGHNGLSMLVHQAAEAFELWTGSAAPLEVMRRVATQGA